ncbi:MAG TPA: ATP-binding protein [Saprospiraceae bacterium]|nr:ATP-binding protein [Saprospiraceae bacterium]HMQ83969.1 ATP-binding protein [Saprospiraceae bacterium]
MLDKFRTNLIFRTLLMMGLMAGAIFSYQKDYIFPAIVLTLLLVAILINVIYYITQTNRDLAHFFESIQYNDFTATSASVHKGASFGQLHDSLNMMSRKFQAIRAEKEANHQFLQTIVAHIDIGLLCYNEQEEIILMNKSLQHLLRKSYLINIDGLKKVDEGLWETIKSLKPGDRELVKINIENRLIQIAVQCIAFNMQQAKLRLISFQNIQSELEQNELSAWQKLIRILTHEIMNSVAPITSLSSTMMDMLGKQAQIENKQLEQLRNAIQVIQRRGEGLLNFTETYRTLTRIPPPNFQELDAEQLFQHVAALFQVEIEQNQVSLIYDLPPQPIQFQGDPVLLEQVLVNLIKNALEALIDIPKPALTLKAARSNGKAVLSVIDNGIGISEDKMEQIFVPFYTTKKEGSGIGLSLSRQIMRLHKGSIDLQSTPNAGTAVDLIF